MGATSSTTNRFTEIVESGKLGLIRNVELRQGLAFYHVLQQREDRR